VEHKGQEADVVFLGTNKQPFDTVFDFEAKKFAREVDASVSSLFLSFGFSAAPLHEILEGIKPVACRISKDLAWAV
jgi:hypothetical protein